MLIAVGDRYDRITSWGAITTSNDGYVWDQDPINPFDSPTLIRCVATSPDKTVILGDGGLVSNSADLNNWSQDKIWFGNFQPLAIDYNTNSLGTFGMFMAVGQGKFLTNQGPYPALSEAAQIFRNLDGENWSWELIYSYDGSLDSRFYGVKRINTPVDTWIAVGSADNKPLAVYSTNSGATWSKINLPYVNGVYYAYDVVYNDGQYWFTVNNMVWSTPSLENPIWDASAFITPKYGKGDLKQIAAHPVNKHMVTACSGGLVYTTDLSSWYVFNVPGYRFRSITFFQDHWIAGAESNLTTYTYWTSTDTVTWEPRNNQVQIYDFAQI